MSKKTGTVLLAEQSRRISLRCPVILASAKLMQDRESGKYSITAELEYPLSAADTQNIRSVILVVRVPDKAGNAIPTGDESELLAKQIRFGEEGFPCGESTAFSFSIDINPAPGTKFGAPDVAISRIHFEDGSIVDYLRGDFFPVPVAPVPLEKKYDAEGVAKIRARLGEQAIVVPEKLSPVVWRCTCGELCQEGECANCKASKSELFAYFGDTELILHPGFNYHKLLKIALIITGSVVAVLALVLTTILLVKNSGNPANTDGPGDGPSTSEIEPPDGTEASERVRFYLGRDRYEDAWAVAEKEADAESLKVEICLAAIEYYRGVSDYESACLYGERLVENQNTYESADTLAALYEEAYDYYTGASDWESACELAMNRMQDSAKLAQAANDWISAVRGGSVLPTHTDGTYLECLWIVDRYLPEDSTLKKSVVSAAVDAMLAENKFAEAEEFAGYDPDGGAELQYVIRKSAVEYYLGQKNYPAAFEAALRTDDAELIARVCEQIPDMALRANLPTYISYLWGSPDKLRTVLANTIAQDRFAARINDDGTVSYGPNRLFDPEAEGYSGAVAVSVAVGSDHVAILLNSGSVVVVGADGKIQKKNGYTGSGAIAVSAAGDYTLVLLETGKVQLCGNSPFDSSQKSKLNGLTDVISVAAGEKHALFLKADGSVTAIGDNGKGQCNTGDWTGIVQIAAGISHSVGLKADGTLVGCGNDANGRMDFSGWTDVVAISAGRSSTAAIRQDGSVLFAGGTIGATPANPAGLTGITEICAGQFGMLVKDGSGLVRSVGQYAPDLDGFPEGAGARG